VLLRVIAAILLLFATGCAGTSTNAPKVSAGEIASEKTQEQIFQIQKTIADTARLANVAYRVELANRADCEDRVGPRVGLYSLSASDFSAETHDAAIAALNLTSDQPTIVHVTDAGPAARGGLARGDVLIAINGEPVPTVKHSEWMNERIKENGNKPIAFTIARNGQSQSIIIAPETTCAIPTILVNSGQANAFTDGKRIVIYSRILQVAQTDDELALVVGHELAHVNMKHVEKHAQNQVAGALGGAVVDVVFALARVNTNGAFTNAGGNAGAKAYSMDFEKEADYVGAYYVARAGYNVIGAERLWRALAQEDPKQVVYASLHPTSPERFVQMEKTADEISRKLASHQALTPEMKQ
jgi:beta-barrel assembly-enhancing protease